MHLLKLKLSSSPRRSTDNLLPRRRRSRPLRPLPGCQQLAPWALVGLLATCLGGGCARPAQATPDSQRQAAFPLASPTVSDALFERGYVAEIRARRRIEIRSRIKGFIESVAVDEGEAVDAGQLLFTVDVTNLKQEDQIARAAIARARADLESAQLELQGTRLLFDKRVVSETELALAKAKAQSAQASLQQARATRAAINLEYARIAAPFAGRINRIPYRMGSPVDDAKVLTTLTDASEIYAYFRLSEAEYLAYTASGAEFPKQVWLQLADGSPYPSPGVVDAVETEFNRDTGSIALRARFPNPDGSLKHGSTGTVIVRKQLQAALTVPQKSTFEVQEQLYVYVVDPSHTARARRIVPSLRLADSFVVASGLDKGDRFVLEGVQKLRDGMRVEALPAAAVTGS